MKQTLTLGRREFTVQAALALLSGAAITISGCGGGGGSPTTPSTPSPGPTPAPSPAPSPSATPSPVADKVGAISANHGHRAVITGAQISAGNALTLDIRGTADHDHTISLTAAQIMAVGAGQRVSVESTTEQAHDHTVTFN